MTRVEFPPESPTATPGVAQRMRPEHEPGRDTPESAEVNAVRALVVEDNPKMAAAIAHGLKEQAYAVDTCGTGFEGEEAAAGTSYDVLILDLMLPDRDGLEVCRSLRRRGIKTPILILSAISATSDRVTGLNAGADDYLAKPFEFEELLARVRALLEYFIRNSHRVLTRTQIGEHVWDMNFEPGSNVIDVYVSALRRKIDKGFDKPLIHTIIGAGYMLALTRP